MGETTCRRSYVFDRLSKKDLVPRTCVLMLCHVLSIPHCLKFFSKYNILMRGSRLLGAGKKYKRYQQCVFWAQLNLLLEVWQARMISQGLFFPLTVYCCLVDESDLQIRTLKNWIRGRFDWQNPSKVGVTQFVTCVFNLITETRLILIVGHGFI